MLVLHQLLNHFLVTQNLSLGYLQLLLLLSSCLFCKKKLQLLRLALLSIVLISSFAIWQRRSRRPYVFLRAIKVYCFGLVLVLCKRLSWDTWSVHFEETFFFLIVNVWLLLGLLLPFTKLATAFRFLFIEASPAILSIWRGLFGVQIHPRRWFTGIYFTDFTFIIIYYLLLLTIFSSRYYLVIFTRLHWSESLYIYLLSSSCF